MLGRFILDRHEHAVAHEIDVSADRFRAHLQFVGELPAIGEVAPLERFMNEEHAFDSGTLQTVNARRIRHVLFMEIASDRINSETKNPLVLAQ